MIEILASNLSCEIRTCAKTSVSGNLSPSVASMLAFTGWRNFSSQASTQARHKTRLTEDTQDIFCLSDLVFQGFIARFKCLPLFVKDLGHGLIHVVDDVSYAFEVLERNEVRNEPTEARRTYLDKYRQEVLTLESHRRCGWSAANN